MLGLQTLLLEVYALLAVPDAMSPNAPSCTGRASNCRREIFHSSNHRWNLLNGSRKICSRLPPKSQGVAMIAAMASRDQHRSSPLGNLFTVLKASTLDGKATKCSCERPVRQKPNSALQSAIPLRCLVSSLNVVCTHRQEVVRPNGTSAPLNSVPVNL